MDDQDLKRVKTAADECIARAGTLAEMLTKGWPIPRPRIVAENGERSAPTSLFEDVAVVVTLPLYSIKLRDAYHRLESELSEPLYLLFCRAANHSGTGAIRFASLPVFGCAFRAVQEVAGGVLDIVARAAFDGSGGVEERRARWARAAERYKSQGWERVEIDGLKDLVAREYAAALELTAPAAVAADPGIVPGAGQPSDDPLDTGWTLEPGAATFRGVRMPLTGIKYRILAKLIDSAPRAVTVEELLAAGWPDGDARDTVEAPERNLSKHVSDLRAAIHAALAGPLSWPVEYDPVPSAGRGRDLVWRIDQALLAATPSA